MRRAATWSCQYSDRQTQSAVGRARGVLGDSKKISVSGGGSRFTATDLLRPPAIITYDMKGDPIRTEDFLNGRLLLNDGDIAADDDNNWTDGAVDDAHVYAGYTYDYYFKRFGRHGLDNNNIRMRSLVQSGATSCDLQTYGNRFPDFFVNAFYAGDGVMVYGDGLPPGFTLDSRSAQSWDYLSGALDIVAHELTHGVTEFTSNLIYRNESGALNEAFSDMMGTSVEFFFQPPGSGPAEGRLPDRRGRRDAGRPALAGEPGAVRRSGSLLEALHRASPTTAASTPTRPSPTRRSTWRSKAAPTARRDSRVQGVGAANREQIEKVVLPRVHAAAAGQCDVLGGARAPPIQAARDLYGAGSAAERAVTQAWTAVGVN